MRIKTSQYGLFWGLNMTNMTNITELTGYTQNTGTTIRDEYQIDVIDHPSVGMWMRETAKKDPQGFLRLTGDNTKDFLKFFGKPKWKNDGKKGWTHGWSVHENNLRWLILTGEQGTIFRLRVPVVGDAYLNDPRVGVGIIQYLSSLLKILAN